MRGRRLLWIAAGALVVAGAAAATGAQRPGSTPLWKPVARSIGKALATGSRSTNVLLIGNNARNAASPLAPGQADILMVAHVDPAKNVVTLVSIPRNVLFAYPRWRDPIPKIKSAFFLGAQVAPAQGPRMAMAAVSRLTGLKIRHYIVTDFQGFVDAVNAVGGVKIDVPARLYDPANSGANFQPGVQRLDGQQALAYVRIRQNQAADGARVNDFQRMNAEAQVLSAIKAEVLEPARAAASLPRLLSVWSRDVRTNLSTHALVGLALEVASMHVKHLTLGSIADSMQLGPESIPGVNAEGAIEGAYYDVLSPAHIVRELAPLGSRGAATGLPPLPSPASVEVIAQCAATWTQRLVAAGFQVHPGAVRGGALTVWAPAGALPQAWAVARALGAGNEAVLVAPVPEVTVTGG